MKLSIFTFLVAFLFIGLASFTIASSNEGSDKTPSDPPPYPGWKPPSTYEDWVPGEEFMDEVAAPQGPAPGHEGSDKPKHKGSDKPGHEGSDKPVEGPPPYPGWKPPATYEDWAPGDEFEDEVPQGPKPGYEDEVADLWRRFLIYECWVKSGHRTQPLFELRTGLYTQPLEYVMPDPAYMEWVQAQLTILAPSGPVTFGDVWDCEYGGLRQWARLDYEWDRADHTGDPGALRGTWQIEDDHFRAAIADPAVSWRNATHRWKQDDFWRKIRRGYFSIPLHVAELYPRFNE